MPPPPRKNARRQYPHDCTYNISHLDHLSAETTTMCAILGHAATKNRAKDGDRKTGAWLLRDFLESVVSKCCDKPITLQFRIGNGIRLRLLNGVIMPMGRSWPDFMEPFWEWCRTIRECPASGGFFKSGRDAVCICEFIPAGLYIRAYEAPSNLGKNMPAACLNLLGQLAMYIESTIFCLTDGGAPAMDRRKHPKPKQPIREDYVSEAMGGPKKRRRKQVRS